MYLSLEHFTIPITTYNIDIYHNILNYRVNSINYSLIITAGNYSIDTLITYLNSNLTNLTATYSSSTYKITFTSSYSFQLLSTSTALTILGFNDNTTYNSVSNSLTSPNTFDLSGVNSILILTNFITRNLDSRTQKNSNYLKIIPVNVSNGNILSYVSTTNRQVKIYDNHINFIAIQLQDENRNILQLNGSTWDMTLIVELVPIDISEMDDTQLSLYNQQQEINKKYIL